MGICKHCKKEFVISDKPKGWMANHSRWCDKNPKRQEYENGSLKAVVAMNETRKKTGISNQYVKAKLEGKVIESSLKGKPGISRPHTEETKQLLREKALASPHRRLRKGTIKYKDVLLESSWELILAKRLDEQNIVWFRPEPIPWFDKNGVKHNYFPDFYLPEYDIFLDPKNPQAVRVQQEKLDCLLTQYKNIVIIRTLEECKNFSL